MTKAEKEKLYQLTLIQLHLGQLALCASHKLPDNLIHTAKQYGAAVSETHRRFGEDSADS